MPDPFPDPRRSRRRALGVAIVLASGVAATIVARAAAMPGESFEGPAPPATADERRTARRLDADVRLLARTIGERNEARYDALSAARDAVERRLREAGAPVRREGYTLRGRRFDNLVAELGPPGRARVVIGAHYDSAPGSPGGNDDATGVAVLLELAARLTRDPPPTPVRCVAFVNEEPPHFGTPTMGSRVLARAWAERGELPDRVVVLDSVGFYTRRARSQRFPTILHELLVGDRGDFVAFVGDRSSEALLREAISVFRASARVPSEGAVMRRDELGASWSDHASFWAHGVPAVLVTDTAGFRDPHYHRATDDGAQIDALALARLTDAMEAVVRALARP